MRRGSSLRRATGLVGLVAVALAVPPVLGSLPAATSAPYGLQVAFTDERDELWEVTVDWSGEEFTAGKSWRSVVSGPDHVGEASAMPPREGGTVAGELAYVSTRGDDPDGEVYLRDALGAEVQVTCDNAVVETHPVISPRGTAVAFASDVNRNWDIFIASPEPGAPAADGLCADWTLQPVTQDTGDDLWPAWSPSAGHIVFSSTREFGGVADPLGDLFAIEVDGPEPETGIQRLTERGGADTQPAVSPVFPGADSPLVAFTSTRDRADGSISLLRFEPGSSTLPAVHPAFPDQPLQASEPAFAPTSSDLLAWTSTDDDPFGDIWAGRVRFAVTSGGEPYVEPRDRLVGLLGVAESHPAWTAEPDGSAPGAVAFTRRLASGAGDGPADISEALAADGSGRRVMISRIDGGPLAEGAFVYDEAGPTYSPDGQRVAYSRDISWFDSEEDWGRELVVEDVDGTTVAVVPAERALGEVDVDPVWSPDGTRLAFTRYGWSDSEIPELTPKVWVVDLVSGVAHPVSQIPDGASGVQDLDPTWSPNGERIALTRTYSARWPESESIQLSHNVEWLGTDARFGGCPIVTDSPEITDRTSCASFVFDDGDSFYLGEASEATALTFSDFQARLGPGDDVSGSYEADPAAASEFVLVEEDREPLEVVGSRAAPEPVWGPTEIWAVDAADGGNRVRLVYPQDCSPMVMCLPARYVHGDSPTWSPDGRRIAFRHLGGIRVVALADADGDGADVPETVAGDSSVTGFAGRDGRGPATETRATLSVTEDPAWSPDGSEIAFSGQPAGQPDQRGIYAVRPDGSGLRTIAQDRGPETEPAYGFRPPPPPPADVAVTLAVSGSPAMTGDPVTATYTVTNNGPGPADAVTLTTTATAGGTATSSTPGCAADGSGCPARSLAPGESYVYEVLLVYDVALDGLASGTVTTTSVDPDPSNNTARAPFQVRERADVSITVTVAGSPAGTGDTLTATYTVTNDGPGEALGTTLVTAVSPGATASSTTAGCAADGTGCAARDLAPGDSYDYVVAFTHAAPVDGVASGTVTSTTPDPDLTDNSAAAPYRVTVPADVGVTLTISGSPADVGEPITASYVVTNHGPGDAEGVTLVTGATAGGEAVSTTPGCLADASGCGPRDLPPGASFGYDVVLTYDTELSGTATGQVGSTTADPVPGNDAVEKPFEVGDGGGGKDLEADVVVDVELRRDLGWVGGTRTATITVTNDGPNLAQDVRLDVTLPRIVDVVLAPLPCLMEETTCELGALASGDSQELEVELQLRRKGREVLVASATAATDDPRRGNNTDSAELTVLKPVLRVLPSVGRPGQVVLAYGEDLPPRTLVELAWDVGITVDRGPFRVAADGTLRAPLVLVRHDRLGNRELIARSVVREFSPVRAPALVVARMMAPPDFLTRG